jgi:2-phosphosulfolactate phosphatase
MGPRVVIDCFPSCVARYVRTHAIIAVDVIRATTTMVTAVAGGWRCFPASNLDDAAQLRDELPGCLLAGELGGNVPDGFEMNNSPSEIAMREDRHRRLVLLSTSGTELLCRAGSAEAAYAACFRNFNAVASHASLSHERIAVIGAGSRNEFREEDQMCCAWIAERLTSAGFVAESQSTLDLIERWSGIPAEGCLVSKSADYLSRSGQSQDLDFILSHVDDLQVTVAFDGHELVPIPPGGRIDMPPFPISTMRSGT